MAPSDTHRRFPTDGKEPIEASEVLARYVALSSGDADPAERQAFQDWATADPIRRKELEQLTLLEGDLRIMRDRYALRSVTSQWGERGRAKPVFRYLAAACFVGLAILAAVNPSRMIVADGLRPKSVDIGADAKAILDAGACLEKPLFPWKNEVALCGGEVVFNIRHDEKRVFAVRFKESLIRDVGTRFLVRQSADAVLVAVFEGSVELEQERGAQPMATAILSANQSALLSNNAITSIAHLSEAEAASWQDGRLIFNRTTLAEASERLSRYLPRKITVVGADLREMRLSGAFELDNLEEAISAIEQALPIRLQRTPSEIIISPRR